MNLYSKDLQIHHHTTSGTKTTFAINKQNIGSSKSVVLLTLAEKFEPPSSEGTAKSKKRKNTKEDGKSPKKPKQVSRLK